ncbi:rod shape-determining protein RodA [Candidatus Tachikawaea gelatinosa]|uniref:Peptidoglycan glycosyltransferase MrdB n=1 Tax=Candidatus Tachikawaea gelatinosa TaxID=1410383 RepID=A0A090ARQ8_9ENTR|nr:rod shape-determining protein RodA [Candidatus Tachikawaea gelatinosa]BAP58495.1 rod shape-determining membrane protein; cell elongation [Candidatus Tachikawaea gelatinosa]
MVFSQNLLKKTIFRKLNFDFLFLFIIFTLLIYSVIIIWSAATQNVTIIYNKIFQIIIGTFILFITANISPKSYQKYAFYFYIICIFLLVFVNIYGYMSKGSQRWINLKIIQFQPSETLKIAVPLLITQIVNHTGFPIKFKNFCVSLILIAIPAILIAKQPDLGTACIILLSGFLVLFLAGINWKIILTFILTLLIFSLIYWFFFMHDYQKNRILTLFKPDSVSLKAGYHIIQSKIAIGSGGLYGKGWKNGTQSKLQFLPEPYTDFVFSVIAEEFGLIGVIVLIILYLILIFRGLFIAIQTNDRFARILISGLMLTLFFCVFINISMVSGILPVVGLPLPLISYGGSSLVTLMAEFGIIMSLYSHKNKL